MIPTPSYDEVTDFDLFRRDSIPGYTILNEIGKGATGIVYSARSNKTGELVAIKVLFPHYAKNREYLRRVSREAELTRRLKHKNAVAGYKFGRANDHFYFVMEYVPGKTLAQILKEQNKLPEREVARIILQVACALDAAHKLKIVHRDVKPSNIAITPDNVIKLMDFGLAKEELDTSITVHGTILGTPCYISPEQARGEVNVDVRSDIYSLGITAYHALVGEPPFCEFNTTLMLTKKTTDPIPSPKIKNPELSDEICYIIEKMCERDVERRYPDPKALIKDIEDYFAGKLKIAPTKKEQIISKVSEKKLQQKQEQMVRTLAKKITDPAVRALLSRDPLPGKPLFLDSGKVLFYEGAQSREAYVLLQGELEVMKAGRRIASINESGAFVGEMATLLDCGRTATVRALRDSILLQIAEDDFQYFLQSAPALAFRLAKNLAKHLHSTTMKLKALQSRITAIRNYFQLISEELHE
ncbi:protein kinase [Candidatus Sumerlaeota bacterium]|nr:protein kinase [Candidatus Sumerlaeota bacterium]